MFGPTLVSFVCGLIVTCNSHPWQRIDPTKEIVGSNEVDPWDLEPQSVVYYDDVPEKPAVRLSNSKLIFFWFAPFVYLDFFFNLIVSFAYIPLSIRHQDLNPRPLGCNSFWLTPKHDFSPLLIYNYSNCYIEFI